MNTPLLRSKSFATPSEALHQADALKSARNLLRELLRGDKPSVDPIRVYVGVSRALGDKGLDEDIESQLS